MHTKAGDVQCARVALFLSFEPSESSRSKLGRLNVSSFSLEHELMVGECEGECE